MKTVKKIGMTNCEMYKKSEKQSGNRSPTLERTYNFERISNVFS
jgi:hypothetical protein